MMHSVRFEQNKNTMEWRGTCICGWTLTGERMDVQARAATHDLDQLLNDNQPAPDDHSAAVRAGS